MADVVATDLAYINVTPDFRPEDDGNPLGELFLKTLRMVRENAACGDVFWGRSMENPNMIAIVTKWFESKSRLSVALFDPFKTGPDIPRLLLLDFDAGDLSHYPMTEIVLPCFPLDQPREDVEDMMKDFNEALLSGKGPDGELHDHAFGRRGGWYAPTIPHDASPTGQANLLAIFLGWHSKEAHLAYTDTELFKITSARFMAHMLPFASGLEMYHVSFKRLE